MYNGFVNSTRTLRNLTYCNYNALYWTFSTYENLTACDDALQSLAPLSSAHFVCTSVTDRPTDHATRSVTIGRIYVRSTPMRPNNCTCSASYALELCNPWSHVANRHMSISQVLSSCCYLFTVLNLGLLFCTKRVSTTPTTPSQPRPLPSRTH